VCVCPYLNKNETYLSLKFRKIYMFQHRLHLGISSPCGTRRTVDQVPLLGKWSHYCSSVKHILKENTQKDLGLHLYLRKLSKLNHSSILNSGLNCFLFLKLILELLEIIKTTLTNLSDFVRFYSHQGKVILMF
jgi:hypothetical protein